MLRDDLGALLGLTAKRIGLWANVDRRMLRIFFLLRFGDLGRLHLRLVALFFFFFFFLLRVRFTILAG